MAPTKSRAERGHDGRAVRTCERAWLVWFYPFRTRQRYPTQCSRWFRPGRGNGCADFWCAQLRAGHNCIIFPMTGLAHAVAVSDLPDETEFAFRRKATKAERRPASLIGNEKLAWRLESDELTHWGNRQSPSAFEGLIIRHPNRPLNERIGLCAAVGKLDSTVTSFHLTSDNPLRLSGDDDAARFSILRQQIHKPPGQAIPRFCVLGG